jgi:PAS domain S-box-containing protein
LHTPIHIIMKVIEEFILFAENSKTNFSSFRNYLSNGFWYLNFAKNKQIANSTFLETLGIDVTQFDEILHPFDFKSIESDEFIKYKNYLIQNFDNNDLETNKTLKFVHKNGSSIWLKCHTIPIKEALLTQAFVLVFTNVTAEKKKEEFLIQCNTAAKIGYWEVDLIEGKIHWGPITKKIHEVEDDFVPVMETAINFFREGEDRQKISEAVQKASQNGTPYELKLQINTAKGNTKWTKSIGIPEIINGKCVRLYGTFQDIDENEKRNQEIKEVQERLKLANSTSKIGIWDFDFADNNVIWDDVMYELYGISKDTPINIHSWLKAVHREDKKRIVFEVNQAVRGKKEFDTEFKVVMPDWSVRYLKGKAIVQRDRKNRPVRMIGTSLDITHQKLIEEELKASISRNKAFVEQAPTAIAMFDTNMCYIAASQRWKFDYGLGNIDLTGKSHYEIFPEIGEDWKRIHQACLKGETHKKDEDKFVRADGSAQWLKWEDKPWINEKGEIGGIIMFTEDVTSKKQVEEQLLISEQAFRGNFENAAVGMAILNPKGQWLRVNNKVCEILGYTELELMDKSFQDITHPDDLHSDMQLLKELIDGKRSHYQMEKRYYNKNGDVVYAILAVSMVKNANDELLYFISQIIDITSLKTIERELAESLQKNQSIMDSSTQVSIISTDTNGIIKTFNKGAENLLGYKASDIINKKTPQIIHMKSEVVKRGKELSKVTGKKIEGFDVFIEKAKTGFTDTREWTYVKKNKTKFPVQLTITAIKAKDEIVGYLGIAVDISKIKEAEEENQALLMVTQEQNNRLKNFAHIVSHNLRSHSGNIEFLIDILISDQPQLADDESMKFIKNASDGLKETIAHLNEVALINTTVVENAEELNIYEYTQKAINSVSALARNGNVELVNLVDKNHNIYGLPAYLDSIILNFITNGIKYRSKDQDSYVKISSIKEKNKTILIFEDNGVGIDMKRHGSKLFGMYKTFHGNKDSRGIGLFITKSQIEAMGGSIQVVSEPNKGSKFIITLNNENN